MKALVIGATGATGKDLLQVLLGDPSYSEVVIFVRRASGMMDHKLTEIVTDFREEEVVSASIKGDVLFSCLGTTLKAAGSKEKQWDIDYEIPFQFAKQARKNGVSSCVLLSAYGASATSSVFYSQMKGKLEDAIDSLQFSQYIIFKPGLLLRKNTDRFGERVSGNILNFLNRLGLFRKFQPMPTHILANKLAKAPKMLGDGKHIIALDQIFSF